jgi:hypothetical protein
MLNCSHEWEPYLIFGKQGRACRKCGTFEQITRGLFRRLFGYSYLRLIRNLPIEFKRNHCV